jgi:hypothetical protein
MPPAGVSSQPACLPVCPGYYGPKCGTGQTSFSLCVRTKSVTSNSSVTPWDVGSPPISLICSSFNTSEYSGAVHAVRLLDALRQYQSGVNLQIAVGLKVNLLLPIRGHGVGPWLLVPTWRAGGHEGEAGTGS